MALVPQIVFSSSAWFLKVRLPMLIRGFEWIMEICQASESSRKANSSDRWMLIVELGCTKETAKENDQISIEELVVFENIREILLDEQWQRRTKWLVMLYLIKYDDWRRMHWCRIESLSSSLYHESRRRRRRVRRNCARLADFYRNHRVTWSPESCIASTDDKREPVWCFAIDSCRMIVAKKSTWHRMSMDNHLEMDLSVERQLVS